MSRRILVIFLLSAIAADHVWAASKLLELLTQITKSLEQHRIQNYVNICRRSDPEFDDCLRESIEKIKPHLANGIPELGLPGCDPVRLTEITSNQGKGESTVQIQYRNVEISGPSQFALISVSSDVVNGIVRMKLWIPDLSMKSDYSINEYMRPIHAIGRHQANFSDMDVLAELQCERNTKGGEDYLNVRNAAVDMQIGHASVYFSDDQRKLGEELNQLINEKWQGIAEEMRPVLEKTIAGLFLAYSNRLFSQYPLDTIMPA
ncbi:putative beta-carotene-binding protein [Cimex lectularius]|uniref:Uncharacterized protein n=1 Tax=Cimex lectularius TaxID=79782 RepID=A0A8I6RNP4_CIMLE|nr:putative beta-carotene-binding protein [Cimex lectularius]